MLSWLEKVFTAFKTHKAELFTFIANAPIC